MKKNKKNGFLDLPKLERNIKSVVYAKQWPVFPRRHLQKISNRY